MAVIPLMARVMWVTDNSGNDYLGNLANYTEIAHD